VFKVITTQGHAMPLSPNPHVATSLARWHHMVASGDMSELHHLVHADAFFRSPMAFKPYQSAEAVVLVLRTVLGVFQNFRYHRELASADGLNIVLEFSAEVAGKQLKGIDLIRFNDAGLICEFEVMVRPMSGLVALGEEMGRRVGQVLPGFKA
jgi:SnoaL-like domain